MRIKKDVLKIIFVSNECCSRKAEPMVRIGLVSEHELCQKQGYKQNSHSRASYINMPRSATLHP